MAETAITPGTGDQTGAAATPGQTSAPAPSVFELSDESQIRLPGAKEPAKFGDWYRGVQQKITSTGQERAKLAKQLEAYNAEKQEREQELQRLRTALGAPAQPAKPKPLADGLKGLDYLDGRTSHDVVSALEGRLAQFEQQIEVRDRALKFIASKLAENMQTTQTMTQREAQAARQAKVRAAMKALDMPDEAEEVALDLYHSYEGEELDDKYPDMLKERWEQIQNLIRTLDKRKVDTVRKARFTAPKGGDARPGGGLDLSRASAKETADALWDMVKDTE